MPGEKSVPPATITWHTHYSTNRGFAISCITVLTGGLHICYSTVLTGGLQISYITVLTGGWQISHVTLDKYSHCIHHAALASVGPGVMG